MIEKWQLDQRQGLPLEVKIIRTEQRIIDWYEYWDGDVYISFSGGKDSTVLFDIARKIYPDIPAMFLDTGLEYPEIRNFVKTKNNVSFIKPRLNFREVIDKYGYPVVNKEQAAYIYQYRTSKSAKLRNYRWNGDDKKRFKISEKWKFLVDAPFKISSKCCDVMKINPSKCYERKTKQKPILGTMAVESYQRTRQYLRHGGCNAFELTRPRSNPLGFWTEQDVLKYLKQFDIPYATVYGDIIEKKGELVLTGESRTGCMFCMFGVQNEEAPNKFQRMKEIHPNQYNYCINNLKIGEVLDYMGIKY